MDVHVKRGRDGARALLIVLGFLLVLALAATTGFAIGSSSAAGRDEAAAMRKQSYRAAFRDSRSDAMAKARRAGVASGLARGAARAMSAGAQRGTRIGSAEAEGELERIATQEAEAAAQAEAEERAANCGAPLFVEGYCPTDEEIEQENLAESLCGPGDPVLAEEAELHGIRC